MGRLRTWQLFAVCVLVWGTTWHAITYQIGHTSPAVSVTRKWSGAARPGQNQSTERMSGWSG